VMFKGMFSFQHPAQHRSHEKPLLSVNWSPENGHDEVWYFDLVEDT